MAFVRRSAAAPDRQRVLGLAVVAGELFCVEGPEGVHAVGEGFELRDLVFGERLEEALAPAGDALEALRFKRLGCLVGVGGHAGVGQEEMVDRAGGAFRGTGRCGIAHVA